MVVEATCVTREEEESVILVLCGYYLYEASGSDCMEGLGCTRNKSGTLSGNFVKLQQAWLNFFPKEPFKESGTRMTMPFYYLILL